MQFNSQIILASASPYRAELLKNAGIQFDVMASDIDERAIEESLSRSEIDLEDVSLILAQAKATDVSEKNSGAYVIGSDQTLSFENRLLHKPADMEQARRRLLELSGNTHQLTSAIVLVKNGELIWQHVERADIGFRQLTPEFVGRHLASVGDVALTSVGAYQIEGEGVQLFDKVDGDYFSIMGLPLLPLLKELRNRDLIDG